MTMTSAPMARVSSGVGGHCTDQWLRLGHRQSGEKRPCRMGTGAGRTLVHPAQLCPCILQHSLCCYSRAALLSAVVLDALAPEILIDPRFLSAGTGRDLWPAGRLCMCPWPRRLPSGMSQPGPGTTQPPCSSNTHLIFGEAV